MNQPRLFPFAVECRLSRFPTSHTPNVLKTASRTIPRFQILKEANSIDFVAWDPRTSIIVPMPRLMRHPPTTATRVNQLLAKKTGRSVMRGGSSSSSRAVISEADESRFYPASGMRSNLSGGELRKARNKILDL